MMSAEELNMLPLLTRIKHSDNNGPPRPTSILLRGGTARLGNLADDDSYAFSPSTLKAHATLPGRFASS
jgi:hypothetical protein